MKIFNLVNSFWKAIFLLVIFFMVSCQATRDQISNRSESLINQEILSDEGELILVGEINREGLAGEAYRYWFDEEYQAYQIDEQALVGLEESLKSVQILVFLGTWCSDSQQALPPFYKIMDYLAADEGQLSIVALDNHPERYKKSPQHEEEGWNIEYVPTFIVVKDGQEIGRIVEAPQESLERDLVNMLKGVDIVH